MLNMNSPTVQAMMQNVPQGIGNMPVYYGNTPVVTSQDQTPYPSPKEMLTQVGQQNIYAPTSMQPNYPYFNSMSQYGGYYNPYTVQPQQQFVGGYNPGFDAAFSGYSNPYMGYGYSGYGMGGYNVPQYVNEEQRMNQMLADMNGVEYDEQLRSESNLYKAMARIVGNTQDFSDEKIKELEDYYEPYKKEIKSNQVPYYYRPPIEHPKVILKRADGVSVEVNNLPAENYMNSSEFDRKVVQSAYLKAGYQTSYQMLYKSASERQMDNADLYDFFNGCAPRLMSENIMRDIKMQSMSMASRMYNSQKFLELLKNNGQVKSRSQERAIERFVGRYGVMPDGRPVSPGHNPAVAQSFSMNTQTGQIEIQAPNFIANRIDQARKQFIASLDNPQGVISNG